MEHTYIALIMIASIILAFVTSVRIAYVLFARWNLYISDKPFFSIVCGVVAATAMAYISHAAIDFGGVLAGALSVFAAVPIVGFVWVYMVGGNKALERILDRLVERIS